MGCDQFPRLRINEPRDFFAEQTFAIAGVFVFVPPCKILGVHSHERGEAHIAQAKAGQCTGQFVELIRLQFATRQCVLKKNGCGKSRDDSAIKIKNCGCLRAGFGGVDIGNEFGKIQGVSLGG